MALRYLLVLPFDAGYRGTSKVRNCVTRSRSMRTLGYAGHRSAKEIPPPSLKPGETVSCLAHKFSSMVRNTSIERPSELTYTSLGKQAFCNVKQGDFIVPDKRGLSAKYIEQASPSKPFAGQSTFANEIRQNAEDTVKLRDIPLGTFLKAFDATGPDENGLMDTRKCREILQHAFQTLYPPRWVVDKFAGYFHKYGERRDGRMSFDEFQKALKAVLKSCESEATSKPVGFPQWIKDSKKAPIRVVTSLNAKSNHQLDVGSFGDQPLKRRYTYKATMAGTTLDILEGTHKHTYNLPGYGGSIPCSLRLARQRDQAEKLHPHLPRMDLLLTYHNNLPGYTGYSPVYSLEGAKPRNCGANPKTTTGAGVLGLML